jgi:hypothetical protein
LLDAYLKSLCASKAGGAGAISAAAIEATSLVEDLYDSSASPCPSIASASASELQCLTHPMHQDGNRGPMQDPLLLRHYASDSP